jgi:1,3-beta-glucan synthase
MKQSKLRRRRVIRYAILYFVLLVVFVGLIAGPVAYRKVVSEATLKGWYNSLNISKNMPLMQPNFLNNANTHASSETGTANPTYSYPSNYGPSSGTDSSAQSTS